MTKFYTVLFALCGTLPNINAQSVDSETALPGLVIRENRLELPFAEQSRSIQILTRARLEAMPVRTVAEALQSVAGLDVRQRGPFGVQADLHARGGGFDQALVLIDGVRLSDPQTGHHLLNLPIDWNAIERIEILQGSGARIFGQNAFACAVNIVTKTPEAPQLSVGAAAGAFGYQQANLYTALPGKTIRQQLSVSRESADGYRYNTDFKVGNAFYQAGMTDKSNGQWNLTAGFTDRRFGANGYYGRLEFRDQYEAVQTSIISLGYRKKIGNWLLKPRVYWRRNQDEYLFTRSNPAAFRNFHISQVVTTEVNATHESRLGHTGIGLSGDYTRLQSNNLGRRERRTVSFFAEHRFALFNRRLDVTPGVSVSHFSDFGTFFFPGLDAGFRLRESWKVFANAGYNYRIPTFTDLFYEDRGNKGNPDLVPERAFSAEIGLQYQKAGWQARIAAFRRDGNNLIDYSKERESDRWTANNFQQVLMQGVDLSGSVFFPAAFGEKTWLRRISAGYTFLDANVDSPAAFSRYTLNNLRHQLTADLEHRLFGPVRHSIRLRWCDRLTANTETRGDYWVADAKLFFETRRLTVFVEATNFFNVTYGELRYSDTAILTMPGRWLRAGANFRF
jgi:vitamin B12 transporter